MQKIGQIETELQTLIHCDGENKCIYAKKNLSGADAPAVPLFGFAIFPRPGEIFPKGGALGKEGKLFLYPLYSFALAIC